MITKFDSLFAGHVDIEDVGYGGVAVNDRRYSNEHLATVFDKAEAMATLMDRLGYHAFWMAEHHFQHEGYECIPNVLMAAVHLAQLTRNIKIGCAGTGLPPNGATSCAISTGCRKSGSSRMASGSCCALRPPALPASCFRRSASPCRPTFRNSPRNRPPNPAPTLPPWC